MPPAYFPLRWESIGDQWWFASPIDLAAANGQYDLVRELLHLDPNLLIKLTSLRQIRRLETIWDDETQFNDVAKCRSHVARKLLFECEIEGTNCNSLIRAGYGGWLLYTATAAGDVNFVKELLDRDPLLVFGEGEYGITDIFYAASRSKNSEVFRLVLDFSALPRYIHSIGRESKGRSDEVSLVFKWEIMNRAVHAAARGGNLGILKELLGNCSDFSVYRDGQGSTVLHTAAGRGQVEVVEDILASSFDIVTSIDNEGNTALNVASYRGYLAVVRVLVFRSPSSTSLTNSFGDTFLHMAVAGFKTPNFRRLDRQIELMKELVSGTIVDIQDIINVRNNDGRTALHMAITENIQLDVMELLMNVPSIDLNVCDADGMTLLDLLKWRPRSASSEILIKRLVSAGGFSNCRECMPRSGLVSSFKMMRGVGGNSSPGASFRVPDAEIFLFIGIDNESKTSCATEASTEFSSCSSELRNPGLNLSDSKKSRSVSYAARRLRALLEWPLRKERKTESMKLSEDDDNDSSKSFNICRDLKGGVQAPLRQRFSRLSSLPNNKRTTLFRTNMPSPSAKKKFVAGLMHGVIQVMPQVTVPTRSPYSSPFSSSSVSSPALMDKDGAVVSANDVSFNGGTLPTIQKQASLNKRLMNQYFCFGAQGLAVEDSIQCKQSVLQ